MNFLKAYKEKILDAPSYDDDYGYYLVEKFIMDYIPRVIENCVINNLDVDIAFKDIEEYFQGIITEDIATAVETGKIQTEDIKKYVNKFSYHIPVALSFISSELPFSSKCGHIAEDLLTVIQYYYAQVQCDEILRPLTPQEKEFKTYTRNVFEEKVIFGLIPSIIETYQNKRKKAIELEFAICKEENAKKTYAKFGNLEFRNVDYAELGRCIKSLPGIDVTDYDSRSKDVRIENVYKYVFNLQTLEEFYAKAKEDAEKVNISR